MIVPFIAPPEEAESPIDPCSACHGVGTWLQGTHPELGTNHAGRRQGDGPWWSHCGACHGVGLTSHGARVGARVRYGGLGWCTRCLTLWAFVPSHVTYYTPTRGCFPLCEKCWADLTPRERLPYYADLVRRWDEQSEVESAKAEQIGAAVMAGL